MVAKSDFDVRLRAWLEAQTPQYRAALLTRTLVSAIDRLPVTGRRATDLTVLAFLRATSVLWASTVGNYSLSAKTAYQSIDSDHLRAFTSKSPYVNAARRSLHAYAEAFHNAATVHDAIDHLTNRSNTLYREQVLNDMLEMNAAANTLYFLNRPIVSARNRVAAQLSAMRASPHHWDVWAAWITDRRLGAIADRAVDIAYVGVAAGLWDNPEAVNSAIKVALSHASIGMAAAELAVVGERPSPGPEDVEPQEPTSIAFQIDGAGRIEIDAAAFRDRIQDSELQRELHEELRSLAAGLRQSCSTNLLAPLGSAIDKFSEAIGSSPGELSPAKAVLRGNALRNDLETDRRRREESDPEKPPVPEGIAGDLQKLVQAWNIYVGMDPFLDEMDSRRVGPDDRQASRVTPEQVGDAVNLAEKLDVATPEAIDALREMEGLANAPSMAERAGSFLLAGFRNFGRAAIKLAVMSGRALTLQNSVIIASAGYGVLKWVSVKEALLRETLRGSPSLLSILDWLAEIAKFIVL